MIESSGQGALSIWTHNLKGLEYQPSFEGSMYSGAAIKMGAGIQAYEAYEFAKEYNVTVVAGEGETVGVAGGYSKFCLQLGCLGSHSLLWVFSFSDFWPKGRLALHLGLLELVTATDCTCVQNSTGRRPFSPG